MCSSSPRMPAPLPPPPPPVEENKVSEETKKAKKTQESQAKKSFGRQSTALTGSLGDQSEAKTAGKTLLGQ